MQEIKHKKSIIKQNILHYIEIKGITKYNFYQLSGITRGVLDQPTGISEENIARFIAYFPEVNTEWLLTGNGSITKDINERKGLTYVPNTSSITSSFSGIPYYEQLPASAGDFPSFLNQAKPTSHIDLPQITDCIAVLPVYGSSMKGVIEPGDLIAIKEVMGRGEFDPALPYLVITEEHRMIKYLHVDEVDDSIIWAESTNHAKIKLHAENIKIVYAIKCVIRFF